MAVQRRAQTLLVQVVPDEPDAASEHEQAVQRADLDVLLRLLLRERARVSEEVDEADGDAAVDVEDELKAYVRKNAMGGQWCGDSDIPCPSSAL